MFCVERQLLYLSTINNFCSLFFICKRTKDENLDEVQLIVNCNTLPNPKAKIHLNHSMLNSNASCKVHTYKVHENEKEKLLAKNQPNHNNNNNAIVQFIRV